MEFSRGKKGVRIFSTVVRIIKPTEHRNMSWLQRAMKTGKPRRVACRRTLTPLLPWASHTDAKAVSEHSRPFFSNTHCCDCSTASWNRGFPVHILPLITPVTDPGGDRPGDPGRNGNKGTAQSVVTTVTAAHLQTRTKTWVSECSCIWAPAPEHWLTGFMQDGNNFTPKRAEHSSNDVIRKLCPHCNHVKQQAHPLICKWET